MDVDGTMTDGGICYIKNGNESKNFAQKMQLAFCARKVGIQIVVITGRECAATTKRLNEVEVDYLFQNIKNKKHFLQGFMLRYNIEKKDLGYIGDDLKMIFVNVISKLYRVSSRCLFRNKKHCQLCESSKRRGGAVRDVLEHYPRTSDLWNKAIKEVYNVGI